MRRNGPADSIKTLTYDETYRLQGLALDNGMKAIGYFEAHQRFADSGDQIGSIKVLMLACKNLGAASTLMSMLQAYGDSRAYDDWAHNQLSRLIEKAERAWAYASAKVGDYWY